MAAIRPLNDALKQIVKEELNEVESRLPEDIAALRTWIQKQPHLRARIDDQTLVGFLRGCKHSLEKAKSKIDFFYTIKTMVPEMFHNNIMDELNTSICRSGAYINLPEPLGPGGPRIHVANYSRLDQKKYYLKDLFRYQALITNFNFSEDDNCIISGYIEIIDFTKISLSFLSQLDPVLVKKLAAFSDKATPARLKGVHVINVPKEAYTAINMMRSLLSDKLRKRLFVHKTLEDLYKHVPKEYLPTEYGGTNGSIDEIQAATEKQLLELNDYWKENDNYGVDEKLRPGKKLDMDSLFGIDGSFRKLNID